jgi:hypothetical protein
MLLLQLSECLLAWSICTMSAWTYHAAVERILRCYHFGFVVTVVKLESLLNSGQRETGEVNTRLGLRCAR